MFKTDDIFELATLEVENRRVFVRADLDCPEGADGSLLDESKVLMAAPTLRWLLDRGARLVVGTERSPGSAGKPPPSVEAVGARLAELLAMDVLIPDENLGAIANKLMAEQRPKELILLENLALDEGELEAEEDYARKLAAPFDVYVCDGLFGPHKRASLSVVPKFCEQRGMGLRLQAELSELDHALRAGRGSVWLVDGSFEERRPILERALALGAKVLVGARLGLALLAASRREVNVSNASADPARRWLAEAKSAGLELELPSDFACARTAKEGSASRAQVESLPFASIGPRDRALDIGTLTLERYLEFVRRASTVLMLDSVGVGSRDATATAALLEGLRARHARGYVLADATTQSVLREHPDASGRCFVSNAREGVLALIEGRRLPALDAIRIPR